MLHLLLDEHLSPTIAAQILAARPDIAIVALQSWKQGAYLKAADPVILSVAYEDGMTLVTYDQRTIAPLLKAWGEQAISHGGVIFVDDHTLANNDFGGLIRALCRLWDALAELDWTDRIVYLSR